MTAISLKHNTQATELWIELNLGISCASSKIRISLKAQKLSNHSFLAFPSKRCTRKWLSRCERHDEKLAAIICQKRSFLWVEFQNRLCRYCMHISFCLRSINPNVCTFSLHFHSIVDQHQLRLAQHPSQSGHEHVLLNSERQKQSPHSRRSEPNRNKNALTSADVMGSHRKRSHTDNWVFWENAFEIEE